MKKIELSLLKGAIIGSNIGSKIFLILFLLTSCIEKSPKKTEGKQAFDQPSFKEQIVLIKQLLPEDSVLSFNQEFINNEILKGKYPVDLENYLKNECYPIPRNKQELIDSFEGFQNVGDIDNDGKGDFVFVLKALNFCEEGDSYYFSNPKIERIYTESGCCHPYNIFNMGDIDEDGRNEIAQYYSSCSSRFKHIRVWTLKETRWRLLGKFTFTLNGEYDIYEDFDKLYQKKAKGIFQFLEISDVRLDGELIQEWKTVNME